MKGVVIDPVTQLISEEEEHAGISLTSKQRIAFLKILRELVYRDVRLLRNFCGPFQKTFNEETDYLPHYCHPLWLFFTFWSPVKYNLDGFQSTSEEDNFLYILMNYKLVAHKLGMLADSEIENKK